MTYDPLRQQYSASENLESTCIHEMAHALGFHQTVLDPTYPESAFGQLQSQSNDGKWYFNGPIATTIYGDGSSRPIPMDNDSPTSIRSHFGIRGGTMTHRYFRNYAGFMEIEMAALNDIGYEIYLRNFFGRSIYTDNNDIVNTQGYFARDENGYIDGRENLSSYGLGLHIFGSGNRVIQAADLLAGGVGGCGIRIDGADTRLIINPGVNIHANGERGTGLLVAYGSNNHIIHRGDIQAVGQEGDGVVFSIGENTFFQPIEYSYYIGWDNSEEEQLAQALLAGPLVKSFDITGSISASRNAIYIHRNSYVGVINVMRGASIEGDIVSDYYLLYNPDIDSWVSAPYTTLNFGNLADDAGAATDLADAGFTFTINNTIWGDGLSHGLGAFVIELAGGTTIAGKDSDIWGYGLAVDPGAAFVAQTAVNMSYGAIVHDGATLALDSAGAININLNNPSSFFRLGDDATVIFTARPVAGQLRAGTVVTNSLRLGMATLDARADLLDSVSPTGMSATVISAASIQDAPPSLDALAGARPFYSYAFTRSGASDISLSISPTTARYIDYAAGRNALAAASALDQARAAGTRPNGELEQMLLGVLNAASAAEAAARLSDFSPAVLAGSTALQPLVAGGFRDNLYRFISDPHLDEEVIVSVIGAQANGRLVEPVVSPWRFHAEGLGGRSHASGASGEPGYRGKLWGGMLAAEYALGDLRLGAAMLASRATLDWTDSAGKTEGNGVAGALFASFGRDGWFASLDAAIGTNRIDSRRTLPASGTTAQAKYRGRWYGTDLDLGHKWDLNGWNIMPGARMRWYRYLTPATTESGAGTAGLAMARDGQTSLELLARLDVWRWITLGGTRVRPRVSVSIAQETADVAAAPAMRFIDSAAIPSFIGYAPDAGRTSVAGALGMDVKIGERAMLSGECQGEFRRHLRVYTARLGVTVSF